MASFTGADLLLLPRLLRAGRAQLPIFAAPRLASHRKGRKFCLVLDGEVASAAHLSLVQLREVGIGGLPQTSQPSAPSGVTI